MNLKYLEQINDYWSLHSKAFDCLIQKEFHSDIYHVWKRELTKNIPSNKELLILDVGCGPGFLCILLAQLGYFVAGTDYNEKMLEIAMKNAKDYDVCDNVSFYRMDAQKLDFSDSTFDVVVSRNLTWTLENPELAYMEWLRVLKPGGKLLNFDANWDLRFHDEEIKKQYANKLKELNALGYEFDNTELTEEEKQYLKIRKELPMSKEIRPNWDIQLLKKLGCKNIAFNNRVQGKLYDEYYEKLYQETPTFMISAEK